tara:strand:- start:171 stop:458 length:288 start_codon:yes stop_codon:yes gene_type:complete
MDGQHNRSNHNLLTLFLDIKEITMYGQKPFDTSSIKQGAMNETPDGPAPREALEIAPGTGNEANFTNTLVAPTEAGSKHMSPNFDALADDDRLYG